MIDQEGSKRIYRAWCNTLPEPEKSLFLKEDIERENEQKLLLKYFLMFVILTIGVLTLIAIIKL